MQIFGPSISMLERGIAIETQRASIIAHNISNIDTVGYQRISFAQALAETRKKLGLPSSDNDDYGSGEVSLEKEMAALGQVKTSHSSYVRLLGMQMGILKKVVSQGRG